MPTRKKESRNGMRQPHWLKAARLMPNCVARITSKEMRNPKIAVTWIKLV
jgi:hypothetical protein